jgi:transposase
VRAVALDVHRDFCEVAIVAEGRVRSAGRIKTRPEALELFAASLDPRDRVALEVTGNAWAIARIIEPHVARVIVVSPTDTGIRQARAKTDRVDARTLAKLLWGGELDGVWTPDERVRAMRRRLARRAQLVRARSRVKNEIQAVLMRCLKERPPAADLFGIKGRAWLADQQLALCERETVESGLRQVDFLDTEIAHVDQLIAADALSCPEVKRLMTVAGVNVIVAATFMAAVGDIRRFGDRRKLTAYLGLDPKVRQSGGADTLRLVGISRSTTELLPCGPLRDRRRRRGDDRDDAPPPGLKRTGRRPKAEPFGDVGGDRRARRHPCRYLPRTQRFRR